MRTKSVLRKRSSVEVLESRRLLTSAGQLLSSDFNTGTAWPNAAAGGSANVTAIATQTNVGTIDVEHGTVADRTGGENLAVTAPATGPWRAELTSGQLTNPNIGTNAIDANNLGKLTLGFNLSASQARTVRLRVISFNAQGQYTGALETDISPAAADSYQRFSVDLSTMKASGAGTFDPTAAKISFNFEISSVNGWSAAGTPTLRLDNFSYSKPALYVSAIDGKDTDNGTTEALAVATIQKAIDLSQPGDIICVRAGDATHKYTVSAGNRNLITHGGTAAAWISIKNYPGESPTINTEGWAAIQIGDYNPSTRAAIGYVEIRGLHVVGDSLKVGPRSAPDGNYDPANASLYNQGNPANNYAQYLQPVDPATGKTTGGTADSRTNGNGLSVSGGNEANKPHDIRFADNLVEQCSGGGMGAGSADRIQFENNVVRDNCYWDKYATSGISILSTYSFDAITGITARLIRGNISSGNIHKQMWVRNDPVLTQYSDGNGIIIDYNHSTDNTVKYYDRTLVTDNLVFDNGGSGIHSYQSDHVDIVNNTAYLNSSSPHLQYGQIFSQGTDTRIYNNIMVAPVANTAAGESPEPVTGGTKPTASNGIVYKNNVYYGGNSTFHLGYNPNVYGAYWPTDTYNVSNTTGDPKFVNATVNAALADFRLQSTSPAVDKGLSDATVPQKDLLGNVHNGAADAGAYEYYAATPTIVTAALANPSPVTGTTTVLDALAGDNDGPAGLTYTWSTTAKPAGAADVTFDRNGAGVSKTAVATFNRAGAYTLLVTVRDANNLTSTSAVNVTVGQTHSGLTVTPANATVAAGGTQQYAVAGIDQFGQPMTAAAVTWSASGSGTTISTGGLLTASAATGAFTVTASGSGFSNTVNGTVTDQTAPTLAAAVSRKTHGSAGVFDRVLSLSGVTPTVEPRLGGPSTLVLTFSEAIKAADGTLDANDFTLTNAAFGSASIAGNVLTLNLTNVVDASRVVAAFGGLSDTSGNPVAAGTSLTVRALYGDINGSGAVNSTDIALIKRDSGLAVDTNTYLDDINANGAINSTDIAIIKSRSGQSIL